MLQVNLALVALRARCEVAVLETANIFILEVIVICDGPLTQCLLIFINCGLINNVYIFMM